MPNKAHKNIPVEDTKLSSGVELGVWGSPSGSSTTSFNFGDQDKLIELVKKDAASEEFFNKLNKPKRKLFEQCIPLELLHERLD